MSTAPEAGTTPDLSALRRPSGAYAMLAVDQREALRAMFAGHQDAPVPDAQLTRFKVAAARILSPHASAVLVDRQFGLDPVVDEGALAPGCGLIAAADHFEPDHGELVGRTSIDRDVDPRAVKEQGAVALKLLILHRPDGAPAHRIAMVEEFVDMCRRAGLISIVEPVSRPPVSGGEWDWDDGVLAAASELGSLGADLYKAEVPLHGRGDPDSVRRRCARITESVAGPWVVLSSGVEQDDFPRAVELACREGAAGFLAGRAVWASCIGAPDLERDLHESAVPRLRALCDVVDSTVGR
ncbi:sulfofructosephosphate aldolase [Haloactinopolyspora alba]|uniref:Sulfofructosephosphate aldolase n=1 Tax=Haloactinopolyspora alba TaxID=648780 RepID=A0A2P8EG00_9ACTN|nr:aldolase [Haloactinopolyspora alba]PSL08391.1 sulfofructosephosphate aldolase [Haloactinopolyspora alba]